MLAVPLRLLDLRYEQYVTHSMGLQDVTRSMWLHDVQFVDPHTAQGLAKLQQAGVKHCQT